MPLVPLVPIGALGAPVRSQLIWGAVGRALLFPGELRMNSNLAMMVAFLLLGTAVWMTEPHYGIPAPLPKVQATILAVAGVVAAVLIWTSLAIGGVRLDAPIIYLQRPLPAKDGADCGSGSIHMCDNRTSTPGSSSY